MAAKTCARCERKLKPDKRIYSSHTGSYYCWPGMGCNGRPTRKRKGTR